jgi:hypothetical protein
MQLAISFWWMCDEKRHVIPGSNGLHRNRELYT